MLDIATEEQSESMSALLGILYRFGYIRRGTMFSNGDFVWSLPSHWTIRKGIPDKPGHSVCAYILNYNRRNKTYG